MFRFTSPWWAPDLPPLSPLYHWVAPPRAQHISRTQRDCARTLRTFERLECIFWLPMAWVAYGDMLGHHPELKGDPRLAYHNAEAIADRSGYGRFQALARRRLDHITT